MMLQLRWQSTTYSEILSNAPSFGHGMIIIGALNDSVIQKHFPEAKFFFQSLNWFQSNSSRAAHRNRLENLRNGVAIDRDQ